MYCKKLMIFILGVMVALAASAQVYRCKVTSGKIIYKDTLCTGSQDTKLIKRAPTDIEVLEEHRRKSEENERKAGVRAEMAEDSSYVSDHKNRTPEFDSSKPRNSYIPNGINRLAALFRILVVARFKL